MQSNAPKTLMGGGDVKLIAMCALATGWEFTALALLFGFGMGAGIDLLRRLRTKTSLPRPAAPLICIGYAAIYLAGRFTGIELGGTI